MNTLSSLQSLKMPTPSTPSTVKSTATDGAAFKNMLVESFDQVNSMQQEANQAVEGLMSGEDVNPAEVLTAVQKADIAFKMMMQVRNKLVAAYQEVQNIRV